MNILEEEADASDVSQFDLYCLHSIPFIVMDVSLAVQSCIKSPMRHTVTVALGANRSLYPVGTPGSGAEKIAGGRSFNSVFISPLRHFLEDIDLFFERTFASGSMVEPSLTIHPRSNMHLTCVENTIEGIS